jgi:hypothetical protein
LLVLPDLGGLTWRWTCSLALNTCMAISLVKVNLLSPPQMFFVSHLPLVILPYL